MGPEAALVRGDVRVHRLAWPLLRLLFIPAAPRRAQGFSLASPKGSTQAPGHRPCVYLLGHVCCDPSPCRTLSVPISPQGGSVHDAAARPPGCPGPCAGLAGARRPGAAADAGGCAGGGAVGGGGCLAGHTGLRTRGHAPGGEPADRRGRGGGPFAGEQDRTKPEGAAHGGCWHHAGRAGVALVAGMAAAAGPACGAVFRHHAGRARQRRTAPQFACRPDRKGGGPGPCRARQPAPHPGRWQTPGVRADRRAPGRGAGHVHHAAAPRRRHRDGGGGRGFAAAIPKPVATIDGAARARRLAARRLHP